MVKLKTRPEKVIRVKRDIDGKFFVVECKRLFASTLKELKKKIIAFRKEKRAKRKAKAKAKDKGETREEKGETREEKGDSIVLKAPAKGIVSETDRSFGELLSSEKKQDNQSKALLEREHEEDKFQVKKDLSIPKKPKISSQTELEPIILLRNWNIFEGDYSENYPARKGAIRNLLKKYTRAD